MNKQRDDKITRIRTRDTHKREYPLISFTAELRLIVITNPLLSGILATAILEIEGAAKRNDDVQVEITDFKQFADQSGIAICTKYKNNTNTLQAEIARCGASIRGNDVLQITNKIIVQEPAKSKWCPNRYKALVVLN